MKAVIRCAFCLAILLVLASLAAAQDKAPAKRAKKPKKSPSPPAIFKLPKEVDLSPEQQAKLDDLKTQYAGKLTDAQKKVADIYTDDQRAAQQAARKEATAAGKKNKELKAAVEGAVQLTDEQREKLAYAQKELKLLTKRIRKEIVGLLTPEQRQLVKGKS